MGIGTVQNSNVAVPYLLSENGILDSVGDQVSFFIVCCGPDQVDFVSSPLVRSELSKEPYAPIMEVLDALAKVEDAIGSTKKDAFGNTRLSGSGTLADVLASIIKVAAPQAPVESSRDEDTLSDEEIGMGALIGRVEMRVAGTMRPIPKKIITDPDDPSVNVIARRHPDTGKLEPALRRGSRRIVEKGRDGIWHLRS